MEEVMKLPAGMTWLTSQVAGHNSDSGKKDIRMITTNNGFVLKTGRKRDLQVREVSFYEEINKSNEFPYDELRSLTPKYYGTRELELGEQRFEFIVLEDITAAMREPCVMDIKIGERTWDPLATAEKRAAEDIKYVESKKAYGFCIPGFQIYDLSLGALKKYGKDYGMRLNSQTTVEALRMFVNAQEESDNSGVHKILLRHLLKLVKKIEDFFNRQKSLRFYSSSVLIAYDACDLRREREKLYSLSQENSASDDGTNSRLTDDCPEEINWLRVKMIDFTHVFPAETEGPDINYLAGIANLVKVLESLIR